MPEWLLILLLNILIANAGDKQNAIASQDLDDESDYVIVEKAKD